jgi:hypothetical protein
MSNALPLLVLAGGAALLLKKKKKKTSKPPVIGEGTATPDRLPTPPGPEPVPPGPVPGPTPEPTPPGPVPEPEPKPERGEARELKPGTYANVGSYTRYGLLLPYRTPQTTISVRRKSGLVWYPAKQEEARFIGWNPSLPEEAWVDVDVKGEYSMIALDGGPNGVFIAEWVLKATQ